MKVFRMEFRQCRGTLIGNHFGYQNSLVTNFFIFWTYATLELGSSFVVHTIVITQSWFHPRTLVHLQWEKISNRVNLIPSSAVYCKVVNDVHINETILKSYLRVLFAANIESRKKGENFQTSFCGKKEYFQNSTYKNKKLPISTCRKNINF